MAQKPHRIRRLTDHQYHQKLHKTVDKMFAKAAAWGWSWHQLALEAGVAPGTIYRLGNRVTVYPYYRTLLRMAWCLDMDLELVLVDRKVRAA